MACTGREKESENAVFIVFQIIQLLECESSSLTLVLLAFSELLDMADRYIVDSSVSMLLICALVSPVFATLLLNLDVLLIVV